MANPLKVLGLPACGGLYGAPKLVHHQYVTSALYSKIHTHTFTLDTLVYAHRPTHPHTYVLADTHSHMRVHTHTHIMYTHIHTGHTGTCTQAHTHTHTHINTYTPYTRTHLQGLKARQLSDACTVHHHTVLPCHLLTGLRTRGGGNSRRLWGRATAATALTAPSSSTTPTTPTPTPTIASSKRRE